MHIAQKGSHLCYESHRCLSLFQQFCVSALRSLTPRWRCHGTDDHDVVRLGLRVQPLRHVEQCHSPSMILQSLHLHDFDDAFPVFVFVSCFCCAFGTRQTVYQVAPVPSDAVGSSPKTGFTPRNCSIRAFFPAFFHRGRPGKEVKRNPKKARKTATNEAPTFRRTSL